MAHEHGMKSDGKKPAGMRHMTKKPKKMGAGPAKNTMGMGKSKGQAHGAMGKHQKTVTD